MVTIVPGPKTHCFFYIYAGIIKTRVVRKELSVAIALSTETINRAGNKPLNSIKLSSKF